MPIHLPGIKPSTSTYKSGPPYKQKKASKILIDEYSWDYEDVKDKAWLLPDEQFKILDDIFHFEIDAFASDWNAKCKHYWTIKDDALKQDWKGKTIYANPPFYSKCIQGTYPLISTTKCGVLLQPFCSTQFTKYFSNNIPRYICIPPTRLKFLTCDRKTLRPLPYGCAFLIWSKRKLTIKQKKKLTQLGNLFETIGNYKP